VRDSVRPETFVRRIRCIRLVLVLVLLAVVARLVDVQVLHSAQFRQEAGRELVQPVAIPAQRASLFTRNGGILAGSVTTKTVVADDFQIQHPQAEAASLGPLLGVTPSRLVPMLTKRSGYVVLAKGLSTSRAADVMGKGFPGITTTDGSKRIYPNGTLAAPVIGSVHTVTAGGSGAGASGVEYQYNDRLAGKAGSETLLESPGGVALPGTSVTDKVLARPGTSVELTLDKPLQYTAEQALASEIISSHAEGGMAVVEDVKTGDILAMANLTSDIKGAGTPTAANTPASHVTPKGTVKIGPKGPISEAPSNYAVTQLFEPGSVFKLVTFSAALQDNVIVPNSSFTVPDEVTIDGSVFHDAETHPTEQLTATQILAQSSNVGTSEIAQELGESRLLAQVGKLGFGHATGLGFPGEQTGLIAGATSWEPTNFVSLPIGQVDAVTAMQVLDAYNAVANGGVLVQPRLVRATIGAGGQAEPAAPSPTRRVMTARTALDLRTMYEQVVDVGTGTSAVVPGYFVAGKTGTAQIPSTTSAGYIPGAYMATFVGFAPAQHPVLSAIVVLNRPTPIFGGSTSAPVFAKLMGDALHRYDIPTTPGAPGPGQAQVTGPTPPSTAFVG
jgi:cell division protein FtsI (penicillin-binding protein 3)